MVNLLTMTDRDVVAGVAQLANLLNRRLAPMFERAGLTPQQWGVLSVVAAADQPLTLAAIARELGVTKQNMTGMVSRLEQLGVAERLEDPADLRSSRVQLTRKGRVTVDKLRQEYDAWVTGLGSDSLARAVNRLIEQLEAE